MKIAFATDNSVEINQHFGQAKSFAVYEIAPDACSFAGTIPLDCLGDDGDDKIEERVNALRGCAIVYCTQIGGVAAARLVKNRIHPVKAETGHVIDDILARLQERLATNPPIWLRKALAIEGEGSIGKSS